MGKITIFKGYQKLFRILMVSIIISPTVGENDFFHSIQTNQKTVVDLCRMTNGKSNRPINHKMSSSL